MLVSSRDREFMLRIGRYKAASHAEAESQHRGTSIAERLRRSWALYTTTRASVRDTDREHDDPSPFYALARTRGLYRP